MRTYEGTVTVEAHAAHAFSFITSAEAVGPCLPDVLALEVQDPTHFTAKVRVGLGPVRGALDLAAVIVPEDSGQGARLEVRGGGMGSGLDIKSQLTLTPVSPSATELRWTAEVGISGPLATLGARLIDGQAAKVTAQLFQNIRENMAAAPAR
jgi:hypothetical protein